MLATQCATFQYFVIGSTDATDAIKWFTASASGSDVSRVDACRKGSEMHGAQLPTTYRAVSKCLRELH